MNTVSNTSPIYDIPLTTIDGTDSLWVITEEKYSLL